MDELYEVSSLRRGERWERVRGVVDGFSEKGGKGVVGCVNGFMSQLPLTNQPGYLFFSNFIHSPNPSPSSEVIT